jgi:hypothetical protein
VGVLTLLLLSSLPALGARSSKPKEIVVVGSKIQLDGRFVGKYYVTGMSHKYTHTPGPGGFIASLGRVDALLLGPGVAPNAVAIELLAAGQAIHKLSGKLECRDEPQGETAGDTLHLTLAEAGFEKGTPGTVVLTRKKNASMSIGPVSGKAGICKITALLPEA